MGTTQMQAARLSGSALLALQLHARGYSPDDIAALRRVEVVDVRRDLRAARTALGAATVRAAIAGARRRGLID